MAANEIPHLAASLETRINKHDEEIAGLRKDIGSMHSSVEHLASAVGKQESKLDEIGDYLRRRSATTLDDISKALQITLMGFALISGVVGGIVYISGNANRTNDSATIVELALIKHQLQELKASQRVQIAQPASPVK